MSWGFRGTRGSTFADGVHGILMSKKRYVGKAKKGFREDWEALFSPRVSGCSTSRA